MISWSWVDTQPLSHEPLGVNASGAFPREQDALRCRQSTVSASVELPLVDDLT